MSKKVEWCNKGWGLLEILLSDQVEHEYMHYSLLMKWRHYRHEQKNLISNFFSLIEVNEAISTQLAKMGQLGIYYISKGSNLELCWKRNVISWMVYLRKIITLLCEYYIICRI